MPIVFDPAAKRIILDSASVSATELYSRWVDWAAQGDNLKYGAVFRQVGSDDLGGGLSIPPYYFLQGAWRVRPMEANHTLIITGNLFVEGGGVPVVQTLGAFNVSVQYTVPVQAQGISTAGGGGATAAQVWAEALEGSYTAKDLMRILLAVTAGGATGLESASMAFKSADGAKNRVTATYSAGNRTITGLDPT